MPLPPVGAQLLVFGQKYKLDRDGDLILDCVRDAGYAGVEGAASDAAAYRRQLDARGLKAGGMHTGLKGLLDVGPLADRMEVLGCRDLCNSGLMEWNQRGLDDWRHGIEVLNRAGRELAGRGMRLHYHNHDFEFDRVDGERTVMDLLLEGLDPEAVDLCVDVGWLCVAGVDEADFLLRHRERIGYLHFKDHDGQGWIELGRGRVKWAAVMQALPRLDRVSWVMIEQDSTRLDPRESATLSRAFLRDEFGY